MSKMKKPSRAPSTFEWNEILPWQRDNEFVLSGYRAASFSYLRSTASIFKLHNETANIWSHLLGGVPFLYGLVRFLRHLLFTYPFPQQFLSTPPSSFTNTITIAPHPHSQAEADLLAISIYCLGATLCFVLSTTYHTFNDHSPHVQRSVGQLDHVGIVLVIWGTGISATHFAFYCEPALRNAYFALMTTTALACAIFTLQPAFRSSEYRTMRFLLYTFLGSCTFAPVTHSAWQFGMERLQKRTGLDSFLALALINFSGAAVYAVRIPERWVPRRFDLFGHSHNLMHFLVLTGSLVRLDGLLKVMDSWAQYNERYGVCQGGV